ncbi:MAG: hypothetical protein R2727_00745 [Bacteroidales bacterium]
MQLKPNIHSVAAGLIASMAWMIPHSGLLIILAFVLYVKIFEESIEGKADQQDIFTGILPGFSFLT